MMAAQSSHASVHLASGRAQLRDLPQEVAVAMVFDGSALAVMMATPADLQDFATGFALSEGVIEDPSEIEAFELHHGPKGIEARHWLQAGPRQALAARRRAVLGPVGCGLCGIDSLDQALPALPKVGDRLRLPLDQVLGAAQAMSAGQHLHHATRASHAAGFLRLGQGVVLLREDVGRHNALDKLIGALAHQGQDAGQGAVVLTSRISVDLVQKCARAGIEMLIAVAAPTALAVEAAEGAGITLVALARDDRAEVFCHPHRVIGIPAREVA